MITFFLFFLAFLLLLVAFFFLGILGFFWSPFSVPFLPTKKSTVKKMIECAHITSSDIVYDLGCGDGRIVLATEKAGAKHSFGIEISPVVYILAKINIFFRGKGKSTILFGDFYKKKSLHNADVLFAFLLPKPMEKIFQEIWPKMKPGARIVSHLFTFKNMTPDCVLSKTKEHEKIAVYIKKECQ